MRKTKNNSSTLATAQQGQDMPKEATIMKVRYYALNRTGDNKVLVSWLAEDRSFRTAEVACIREAIYSIMRLMEKGIQPYFISFHYPASNGYKTIVQEVQAINKEDEANFFVSFINHKVTHFRVWRLIGAKTLEHLKALKALSTEVGVGVTIVLPAEEAEPFAQPEEAKPKAKRSRAKKNG